MEPINLIKNHCEFDDNTVYILFAVARKKDNEGITNSQEVIFREVIKSEKDIERKYESVKTRCLKYDHLNFYIYLSVNGRDIIKGYFRLKQKTDIWIQEMLLGVNTNKEFKRLDKHWISALSKPEARVKNRYFMLDIDSIDNVKDVEIWSLLNIKAHLYKCFGKIKTPHGFHMICRPFDKTILNNISDVEVKTDGNMFIEYINNRGE